MTKEENAIILDFLASGYPGARYREPVAQAMGDKFFSFLELIPKDGVSLKQHERVYIGDGPRNRIKLIKRRLRASELTNVASSNMEEILVELIMQNEQKFVEFLNKSGTVTPRMHQLELLPGIGKRYVDIILRNRPYENFADFAKKTEISNLVSIIKKRILNEVSGEEKYYAFTRPIRIEEHHYNEHHYR